MPKKPSVLKSLEAESFCMRDAKGKVRMRLYVDEDYGPVFELLDSKERSRFTIQLADGGRPIIRLDSSKGQPLLGMGVGESADAGLTIYHTNGEPAFQILTFDQTVHVSTLDRNGKVVWTSSSKTDSAEPHS